MWEVEGRLRDGSPIYDMGDDWKALIDAVAAAADPLLTTQDEKRSLRDGLDWLRPAQPGQHAYVASNGVYLTIRGL